MKQKTLADLLTGYPAAQFGGGTEFDLAAIPAASITSVTGDSRAVTTSALFVAIAGDSLDGHRYIPAAVEQGAAAVVGTKDLDDLALLGIELTADVTYLQVRNSRLALAQCAAALYDFPSRELAVIGITGTDGKTTTATILESILAAATRCAEFPAGRVGVITTVGARICGRAIETGFHVTTPDAPDVQRFLAQMRDAGCEYAIVESTSHGLAQDRVSAIEFDVACVTNITHEHIDWHGSRDAYIEAKTLLFRKLLEARASDARVSDMRRRVAVLNVDDRRNYAGEGSYARLLEVLAEGTAGEGEREEEGVGSCVGIWGYGVGEGADVRARRIRALPDSTRFEIQWRDEIFEIETRLLGDFNVSNILCAASVALASEIPIAAIQVGVAELSGIVGRMERIDAGQPFLTVVDFAHSPASLERALMTLRPLVGRAQQTERDETGGVEAVGREPKLIAVFGSAGLRDVEKRRLMGQVSGRLADFTIITAEDPRTEDLDEINRAIAAGVAEFAADDAFTIVPDRAEAIERAVEMAGPGDVVAAFGKGHERTMCFGEIELPWSDQETMRAALMAAINK